MSTPQERIASAQELRRQGRLSAEQDAALSELENRYGMQAAPGASPMPNSPATPTKPVTVLGSTIPGAQTTAPASVMGSPIPRLSEEELQRRRLMDQASEPQDARFTSMAIDPARNPQIAPPQALRPIDTAMRRVGNVANDAAASLYGQSEIRRIENAAARGRAGAVVEDEQAQQMRPPANAAQNAVARLSAPEPMKVSMDQADNPLFFGVESFEDLRPNDPLRDPWFRREMIKRSLRDQAYQRAQGESRTVGKPKEKRTVGKAGAN